jgi:serine/threonine-protein kinase RsbW
VSSVRPPRRITVSPFSAPRFGQTLVHRAWASDLALKQEMIDAVLEALVRPGYLSADDEPMLAICLDEAFANAIRHGNEQDRTKPVDVRVFLDDVRWFVVAEDQGDGFDPAAVPDPTTEAGLMAESGRGLRIMNAWLDQLTYYRDGRTILMARRRADR